MLMVSNNYYRGLLLFLKLIGTQLLANILERQS